MPSNPADGPILGTLYGTDAMRAVFDETAYFQRMLDVEAALARVQARLGLIPADAATAIAAAARFENLNRPPSPPPPATSATPSSAWSRNCPAPPAPPAPGRTGAPPPRTSWTPPPSCRCAPAST